MPESAVDEVVTALIKREQNGSTGFGKGVAVPHAKHAKVKQMAGTIGRSEAGIDFAAVNEILQKLTTISPEYSDYLNQAKVANSTVRDKIRREETYVAFQDQVVRRRAFEMIDPFTGRPCELFDSVMIFDRQIFSFRGSELFFFISGGNMNAGIFLYLLGANLLLQIDTEQNQCSQVYYGNDVHMAELFAVYLNRVLKNYAAYTNAVDKAAHYEGRQREIIAIHGRAENPAHHIWNYLSPFERLNLLGALGNISAIVRPPTEYFGSMVGLFPELATAEIISIPSQPIIDPCPFSVEKIAIWLGGNFIPRNLQGRIHRWASDCASTGQREFINAQVEQHGPIVWIGLRTGDKVWTNQTDGIVKIIDSICAEYPRALFILDGFSVPNTEAQIPEKWSSAVHTLRSVADQIVRSTKVPGCALSLIGNTIAESVMWASKVGTYFAPLGSSQHKVGWYSVARGIIYTTSKIQGTLPELRPGAWEAEGCPIPDFVIGEIASAGKRRSNFDFRINLENVSFDTEDVIDLIRKNLADLQTATTQEGYEWVAISQLHVGDSNHAG